MIELILFIILAAAALAGGLAVVLARNPVYSALGLLGAMFALAVFYVVHLAHFVAAVQLIVYAGAVVTLFLFVIMLIGVDKAEDTSEHLPLQRRLVLVLSGVIVATFAALAIGTTFTWVVPSGRGEVPVGTVEALSDQLFAGWVLPIVSTAVLLTIAAVGAIALAYFRPRLRDRAVPTPAREAADQGEAAVE